MSRPKFQSIPLELRQIKAYELYRKRIIANQAGSSEDDWYEAGEYLAKHPRVVLAWQLKQFFKSLLYASWKTLMFPFWLFWNLPAPFANTDSSSFALDVVKTVISAIGLIATVIAGLGLFFSYQNAQERLITERFSKAVEQIGNNKEVVMIGGIYSLERIAKDSPKDQWTIMEILTSFVRKNSQIPQSVNIQVQTALTVIGRRDPKHDDNRKVLSKILDSKIPSKILDLSETNLDRANFDGAILDGVNLEGVILSEASLIRAKLKKANLSRVDLNRADLNGADLSGAKLSRAYLSRANLGGVNFGGVNLGGADLNGADLGGANLGGANLGGADLFLANLSGAYLSGAYLSGTKNLSPQQIKSACNWEKAVYSDAQWNENLSQWVAKDEKANQQKIEALKQDRASDPKEPVDCSM